MEPILSVSHLASLLGTPAARLREIAENIQSHYREWPLQDKKKHKVRMIRSPSEELKEIQRRLSRNILAPLALGKVVHGGVRGRSPRSNATQHLGQRCVINLDVRDFFPKVRHYVIYRMFRRELGFGRDVARLLTRLTTLNGQLPQGAPTSTALANVLLALPVDGPVSEAAGRIAVNYTRFVDDVTLSGSNPRPLINMVARALSRRRLPVYRKKAKGRLKPKFKITARSEPQEVTGLLVNSSGGPSISRQRRDRVRAAIFGLRKITDPVVFHVEVNSVRGRIAHVRQFNPGAAQRLQRYLESTVGGPIGR